MELVHSLTQPRPSSSHFILRLATSDQGWLVYSQLSRILWYTLPKFHNNLYILVMYIVASRCCIVTIPVYILVQNPDMDQLYHEVTFGAITSKEDFNYTSKQHYLSLTSLRIIIVRGVDGKMVTKTIHNRINRSLMDSHFVLQIVSTSVVEDRCWQLAYQK